MVLAKNFRALSMRQDNFSQENKFPTQNRPRILLTSEGRVLRLVRAQRKGAVQAGDCAGVISVGFSQRNLLEARPSAGPIGRAGGPIRRAGVVGGPAAASPSAIRAGKFRPPR
jgi:hypothetical protein